MKKKLKGSIFHESTYIKFLNDIKLIHKNHLHSYILTMKYQEEKLWKQSANSILHNVNKWIS